MTSIAAIATAYPAVQDWWEGWSSTEEVLDDGRKHLIVTDPDGRVDFDEVLEPDESVFMTEEGDYLVVEPSVDEERDEAAPESIDAIVDQVLGEDRDDG